MDDVGVWSGLMRSAFLAGLGEQDRRPLRIAATLAGGLLLGSVAAFAAWCLIMAPFTFWIGQAGAGVEGLGRAAVMLKDAAQNGLDLQVARLAVGVAGESAFLLVFVAVAARFSERRLMDFVTAAPKLRWRLLLLGMALSGLVIAPMVAGQHLLSGPEAPPLLAVDKAWTGRAIYFAATLLLIPAALVEELFFRGWMLRQIGALADRTAPVLILAGILFAAAHFDFDPEAFLQRALMGGGLAYMTLRLGGIEFAAGVHAMHNILILLFIQPLLQAAASPGLSAFALLYDVALVASYFIITEVVVRWAWLQRLGGVDRSQISPPDDRAVQPG